MKPAAVRGIRNVIFVVGGGLLLVALVGFLLDLVYPGKVWWFQFWKEPRRPGARDVDQTASEQTQETIEEEGITDYCWPWEMCFWLPTNPTFRSPS